MDNDTREIVTALQDDACAMIRECENAMYLRVLIATLENLNKKEC